MRDDHTLDTSQTVVNPHDEGLTGVCDDDYGSCGKHLPHSLRGPNVTIVAGGEVEGAIDSQRLAVVETEVRELKRELRLLKSGIRAGLEDGSPPPTHL
jgi:hypothetical protein